MAPSSQSYVDEGEYAMLAGGQRQSLMKQLLTIKAEKEESHVSHSLTIAIIISIPFIVRMYRLKDSKKKI